MAQTADGLEIRPRPLHGGVFGTYHDHRMAQAAVVLGLRVRDVAVDDIATTSKTHEDFAGSMAGAGVVTPRYDEPDPASFDRPRRRTRPRTKERPTYDDAVDGFVVTVDRGRYTVRVEPEGETSARSRR